MSVLLLRVVVVGMVDGLVMLDGGKMEDRMEDEKEGYVLASPHPTPPHTTPHSKKRSFVFLIIQKKSSKIYTFRTHQVQSSTSKVQHASLPVSADTKLGSCDPSKHGHSRSSPVA